jgi:hypothetical protein
MITGISEGDIGLVLLLGTTSMGDYLSFYLWLLVFLDLASLTSPNPVIIDSHLLSTGIVNVTGSYDGVGSRIVSDV